MNELIKSSIDPLGTVHVVTPRYNIGDQVSWGNNFGIITDIKKDIFGENFWYEIENTKYICETELTLMPDVL